MKKKAQGLSMNMIVVAALALLVLVVIVFIFSDQIKNLATGFTNAGNDAKAGLKGTKCATLLGDRVCSTSYNTLTQAERDKYDTLTIPKPQVCDKDGNNCKFEWSDCKQADCYELIPKSP